MKSPVKLNVGGKLFLTSKETLESSSLISAILNNPSWKAEDGIIYFDKDPKIFYYLLNLLRNEISLNDVPKKRYNQILKQLDYFGVDIEIEENIGPLFEVLHRSVDLSREVAEIFKYQHKAGQSYHNLKKGNNLIGFKIETPNIILYSYCKITIICPTTALTYPLRFYDGKEPLIFIPINISILRDATISIETNNNIIITFLFGIKDNILNL